jgi:acylphosphatase
VVVHGFVQGVGFRFRAADAARTRGVAGWIRNRGDGTVEGVFEGAPDDVESMVQWCERGPRGADVTRVETFDEPAEGVRGFEIRG